jgi:hypothetical protein
MQQGNRSMMSRETFVAIARDEPDKARVMDYFEQFVLAGHATWEMRDNGEIELCFASGETYLLCATTILRLA